MRTCAVDVAPESLYGAACGRLIHDGRCPVHKDARAHLVWDHPEPTPERVEQVLADLLEKL